MTAFELENPTYTVDPETGEILSLQTPKPEFHVTDVDSAEWVLARMMGHESELLKLEAELAAIRSRYEARIKEERRRLEFLNRRFGPELEAFALTQIEGTKAKTWSGTFGAVSFRTVSPTVKVVDQSAAYEWAIENCPTACEKKVSLSGLKPTALNLITEGKAVPGVELVPGYQSVSIKTIAGKEPSNG